MKQENTIIAKNPTAYHNYEILEKYEAGIVLFGTEIKSIRQGKVNLKDSYASIDKNGEGYTKSYEPNSSNVVGVYSTSYGVILGGEEDVSLEENLKTCIPIGISGRVPVKVIGQAHIGDLITSSEIQGVGRVQNSALHGTIIGKCLENKETDDIGLVKILIMLS